VILRHSSALALVIPQRFGVSGQLAPRFVRPPLTTSSALPAPAEQTEAADEPRGGRLAAIRCDRGLTKA
jgi:hypothetical protein